MKTVEIHGRTYETVESRIERFYADHPEGRILTEMLSTGDNAKMASFKASLIVNGEVVATGHAMELQGDGNINAHCHLENAETSAIGRALANWKYAGTGERPSAQEMQKATRPRQTAPVTKTPVAPAASPDRVSIDDIDASWMLDTLGFGKYSDETWDSMARTKPDYLEWLAKQTDKKTGKPSKNSIRAKEALEAFGNAQSEAMDAADDMGASVEDINAQLDADDSSVPF